MKSVERKFYWKLCRMARAQARGNAKLWKEYKRQRKNRASGRLTLPAWFAHVMWPLILLFVMPGVSSRVGTNGFLAMLALYCSGTIFFRAKTLTNALYSSRELFVALHFPLSDNAFFRWQVRNWLLSQASVFLLSSMIYVYAAVHVGVEDEAFLYSLPFIAMLQSLVVTALALAQPLWFPRTRPQIGLVFYALILGVVFLPAQLTEGGAVVFSVLPASLVNRLFLSLHGGSPGVLALLVVCTLGVGAVDIFLVRALGRTYPRSELTALLEGHNQERDEEKETASRTSVGGSSFGHDYAVAQERFAALRNRAAIERQLAQMSPECEQDHWTSCLAARWLTKRERAVAGFLSPGAGDGWRGRWKFALYLTGAGALLCVLPLPIPFWLALGSFVLASMCGAPLLGGKWPALTVGRFGFSLLQPCAGYPLGYFEVSKVMMKWNAARLVGYAPIAYAGGLLIGWRYFSSPFLGILIGTQIMVLEFALQPYFCLFQHSSGTNDTKRFNRTSALFACALIVNVVLFVPAVIMFFAFGQSAAAWVLGPPALFLLSYSMWWFYGFLYSRGHIDLQPVRT